MTNTTAHDYNIPVGTELSSEGAGEKTLQPLFSVSATQLFLMSCQILARASLSPTTCSSSMLSNTQVRTPRSINKEKNQEPFPHFPPFPPNPSSLPSYILAGKLKVAYSWATDSHAQSYNDKRSE